MIAILFSSSVGMSIEWLTGVSQVVGSRPDMFSCDLNFIKALVYTLCEDNLVPWLHSFFSDISLSVCLFKCVYRMLVALSICLRVGAGIVWGTKGSNDRNTFYLIGGHVDRVTDWCVTGRGFAPRRVQLWIKFHKGSGVYVVWGQSFPLVTLLSVCLFMCVYMMFVALSICLQVGVGIVWGS